MKTKPISVRTTNELANFLGLSPADAAEMGFRTSLNTKIIEIVKKEGLTHAEVARRAKTSRTRITAILNRNTIDVSTDLMLRILAALGYTIKVRFLKVS